VAAIDAQDSFASINICQHILYPLRFVNFSKCYLCRQLSFIVGEKLSGAKASSAWQMTSESAVNQSKLSPFIRRFQAISFRAKIRLQTKLQLQSSTREALSVGKWQNGLRGRSAGFMEIQSPAAVSRQPNANSSPISLLFLLRCCLMKIQFHWKLLKEKLIFTLKLAHRWRCLPLTSLYLL